MNIISQSEARKILDKEIRQVKQQLIDNLDSEFNPKNVLLDCKLELKLKKLYAQRKTMQKSKIDTLSDMYLRLYA